LQYEPVTDGNLIDLVNMATDLVDDLQLDPVNDDVIDALVTSTGSDICDDANGYASDEQTYHYYGARELANFHDWYQNYHGYVASIVCVFGILANAVNIVVLTRRNMISATNSILTGLAVADGLTMAVYLPFALRFYVLYGTATSPERNSFEAVCFMMFYASFSVVVHTAAIWLTVVLAVFR
jgi:Serpentine type 7TM GPCR chemoreceptor Srw